MLLCSWGTCVIGSQPRTEDIIFGGIVAGGGRAGGVSRYEIKGSFFIPPIIHRLSRCVPKSTSNPAPPAPPLLARYYTAEAIVIRELSGAQLNGHKKMEFLYVTRNYNPKQCK